MPLQRRSRTKRKSQQNRLIADYHESLAHSHLKNTSGSVDLINIFNDVVLNGSFRFIVETRDDGNKVLNVQKMVNGVGVTRFSVD